MKPLAHLGVFALFLALVTLYTYPLGTAPGTLLPNHHDPRLFGWVMLSIFRNLLREPALLFHGNAFYPFGNTLTYTEPLLTPALVAGPLDALTGNPILAYNLTLLLFWALSGWAMYAVTFWLTRSHPAAFVAALIFTLSPYRTEYYLEFQMQIAFGIPLAVYALVRFLEEQRLRYLAALVLVFWLEAIAVWYYAVILGFGLSAVALQYVALRWTGWRVRTGLAAALGAALLGLGLLPVAAPFFWTRGELGFERGLADALTHAADVLTYVETSATRLYRLQPGGGTPAETALFLGVGALILGGLGLGWLRRTRPVPRGLAERILAAGVVVALALGILKLVAYGATDLRPVRRALPTFSALGAGLLALALARHAAEGWQRRRLGLRDRRLTEREWVSLLLVLAAFAFLLSLGPVVHLARRPIGPGLYAWLHPYLLPLHAVRVTTRFGILVVFAGALLAAFGVLWLDRRLPRWASRATAGGLALLLLVEYASFPLPYGRATPVMRPVDKVLRADPGDVAVLEWPIDHRDSDTDAMFRSLGHGKRVVNGFSGFVPGLVHDLSAHVSTYRSLLPNPEAQALLRRIHPLRYFVVRLADPRIGKPASVAAWRALRQDPPPPLRFRGSFGDEDLYEVVPLPEAGVRLERWVSYDFLHAHPVLRVALEPRATGPDLDQWVDLRLNGQLLRRVPLNRGVTEGLVVSPPFARAAPNVIALAYGYRRPPSALDERYRIGTTGRLSPGDLRVVSRGGPERHPTSAIQLDGTELSPARRGYHLVALDTGGTVLRVAAFDTAGQDDASRELAAWVAALPPDTIVAGAVGDDGSRLLTEDAVRALGNLGVSGDVRGRFRAAHAFVGVKGAPVGSAFEALGPDPVELILGRIELVPDRADPRLGMTLVEFALSARAGTAELSADGTIARAMVEP